MELNEHIRLSGTTTLFLIIFILWWIWQAIKFFLDWPALKEMYNFYTHLLEIPDVSSSSSAMCFIVASGLKPI